jgi:hypothetical protein
MDMSPEQGNPSGGTQGQQGGGKTQHHNHLEVIEIHQ